MNATRREADSLGEVELPKDCLWGVHTARALANFPLSGRRLADEPELLTALLQVKRAAAEANGATGLLTAEQASALVGAADELLAGQHRDAFVVDPIEASGGTSIHMNVNEVLTNVALRRLGALPGDYARLHPNDHANAGQSTNDVLPAAVLLAARRLAAEAAAGLSRLAERLDEKAVAFGAIPHLGRTCLMDAQPITLGRLFGSYASLAWRLAKSLQARADELTHLPLGGTAVGAGWGTRPGYRAKAMSALRRLTGLKLETAGDPYDALANSDGLARLSAEARTAADALVKLGQDLHFLAAGPIGGPAELKLPALQAGSSMMPGKVNPVMPMLLIEAAALIEGYHATVARIASLGQLAINAYEPAMAVSLFAALRLLARSTTLVAEKCIAGLEANAEASRAHLLASNAMTVLLQERLGYAATAALVKRAGGARRTLVEQAIAETLLDEAAVETLLASLASQGPG
jgi:aspartate ammonia-lyase